MATHHHPTHASDQRDAVPFERDRVADERDVVAGQRERLATKRCMICDASRAIPLVAFLAAALALILAAGRLVWVVGAQGAQISAHDDALRGVVCEQAEHRQAMKYIVATLAEIKADVKDLRRASVPPSQ